MKHIFYLSIIIIILNGCTTSDQVPKISNIEKERNYSQPYDSLFNKISEWFSLQGAPINNIDKSSGIIVSSYTLTDIDFLKYCDYDENVMKSKTITNKVVNLNILLKKNSENSTRVIITAEFVIKVATYKTENDNLSLSIEDVKYNSKGILEKEILDFLSK